MAPLSYTEGFKLLFFELEAEEISDISESGANATVQSIYSFLHGFLSLGVQRR